MKKSNLFSQILSTFLFLGMASGLASCDEASHPDEQKSEPDEQKNEKGTDPIRDAKYTLDSKDEVEDDKDDKDDKDSTDDNDDNDDKGDNDDKDGNEEL